MVKRKRTEATRPVSYGVLLHKKQDDEVVYLLGMIPQRNWWTVFKGMPNNDDESPHETALREFREETGTDENVLQAISPEATLYGKTGKKDLVIYLQEGSEVSSESFNLERVVKIDQGYMKGKPEIVAIRWLTMREALDGVDGAKIYKSQESILRDAQDFVINEKSSNVQEESSV